MRQLILLELCRAAKRLLTALQQMGFHLLVVHYYYYYLMQLGSDSWSPSQSSLHNAYQKFLSTCYFYFSSGLAVHSISIRTAIYVHIYYVTVLIILSTSIDPLYRCCGSAKKNSSSQHLWHIYSRWCVPDYELTGQLAEWVYGASGDDELLKGNGRKEW